MGQSGLAKGRPKKILVDFWRVLGRWVGEWLGGWAVLGVGCVGGFSKILAGGWWVGLCPVPPRGHNVNPQCQPATYFATMSRIMAHIVVARRGNGFSADEQT